MTVEIPLHGGYVALIDDCDVTRVLAHRWHRSRPSSTGWFYAQAKVWDPALGKSVTISMHRLIAGATAGQVVDHINGDTLDNRRANLRIADESQNQQSRRRWPLNSTGYRGVRQRRPGKWVAAIKHRGREIHLGTFDSAELAAQAYDAAAHQLFGEFAVPNFPKDNATV